MRKRRTDAGQTLVIVAFGMVILLSFLGLGIDLGYLRLMRRRVQMVADVTGVAGFISPCGVVDKSKSRGFDAPAFFCLLGARAAAQPRMSRYAQGCMQGLLLGRICRTRWELRAT